MRTNSTLSKKIFIILFLGLILFFSCSDDRLEPKELIGKWNWLSSSGGIAGTIYTPENTGDNILIEFTSDSIFKRYLNDSLIMESTFSIQISKSIYDHDSTQMLVFEDAYMLQSFELQSPDELVLFDEVYDGFINHYKRIH